MTYHDQFFKKQKQEKTRKVYGDPFCQRVSASQVLYKVCHFQQVLFLGNDHNKHKHLKVYISLSYKQGKSLVSNESSENAKFHHTSEIYWNSSVCLYTFSYRIHWYSMGQLYTNGMWWDWKKPNLRLGSTKCVGLNNILFDKSQDMVWKYIVEVGSNINKSRIPSIR